ncbi:A24 family peptidase [Hyphomonas sp. UBA4494]|jgi:Flp pilus assembly protein protease CpaA|uniref:A24 family peptidase n=1 Tax=Hyphomonas sp. UBA4494 TaxID=1946631 RepID=UPI0025BB5A38|nr:prepilin peptidase [Hyphomonas sp. UBA4494]
MISLSELIWAVFVLFIAAITLIDARTYRIPNVILLVLAAFGLAAILLLTPSTVLTHLVAALVTLGVGYLLYTTTGFGAGDAKFFAVILLWFGAAGVIPLLFWFGLSCAVLVVLLAIGRRLPLANTKLGAWRPLQKGAPVPLALAIGPAAIIASTQISNGLW